MTVKMSGKIKERGQGCEIFLAPLFSLYYNHIKYAMLEKGWNIKYEAGGIFNQWR